MEKHVEIFLIKSVLGRNVDVESTDSIIEHCISKAYGDMMTVGKNYGIKGKSEKCKEIKVLFSNYNYNFSIDLINDVCEKIGGDEEIRKDFKNRGEDFVTTFGLAQKIVDMTFKYLYCLREYIKDVEIDFEKCDCPVDSIVLSKLKNNGWNPPTTVWSKLTKQNYEEIQKIINQNLLLKPNLVQND